MILKYDEHIKQWEYKKLNEKYKCHLTEITKKDNHQDRFFELCDILTKLHKHYRISRSFYPEIKEELSDIIHNEGKEVISCAEAFIKKEPKLLDSQRVALIEEINFFNELLQLKI